MNEVLGRTEAEVKALRKLEDAAWREAHYIASVGASNPSAVAHALARNSSALQPYLGTDGVRQHPALRAIAGHLAYLYGYGLGPDMGVLDALRQNATRLGIV